MRPIQKMQAAADKLAPRFAVALAFFFPISTFLTGLLSALILLAALAQGRWQARLRAVGRNPVGVAAAVLLLLVIVGLFYGEGTWANALNYGGKYVDLLLIPLLIPIFSDDRIRAQALNAFLAAMLLTLGLSCLMHWGLVRPDRWIHGTPRDASVFKDHITQSILMAYAAFVLSLKARFATDWQHKALLAALAAIAIINIVFMVQGRTGYFILPVLAAYFGFLTLRWRGALVGAAAFLALALVAYAWSPSFHKRMDEAGRQTVGWLHGRDKNTSVGLRLEYYKKSLAIIARHPLFGVGTGGFARAYKKEVAHTLLAPTTNPHNQFILITVELGVMGLAGFLYLLYRQWDTASRLASPDKILARALLLTFVTGCLANSLLIDETERMFFITLTAVFWSTLSHVSFRRPREET
ncbi:O-antigen ligase family protein [Acidiferrobacter sp.]|uniref:O-antigen ligase family protein n=1 Tax=Acidiferrobacter sp. TaxID=1872107 RepID=UPI0026360336|nr:O-antigen ligase family protein [Acidiferrobacter sp.]